MPFEHRLVQWRVSIHLMLLFIQITMRFPHLVIQFQYISCCYLSRYFLSILAICSSFNTSHVVIYQHSDWFIFSGTMFQYISCCYLSDWVRAEYAGLLTFQYISCCYLSQSRRFTSCYKQVFQYISCCYLSNICFPSINSYNMFQYISCCYLSGDRP